MTNLAIFRPLKAFVVYFISISNRRSIKKYKEKVVGIKLR